ncbi:ABC transporter ATP-binding protein [Alkalibacter saccharofermentans]|uniref:ABC-type quaternary amine transporter n=1 Tax=Alkalibacter saccharofermentans DSM 14828 TaxID=1120975 RepID=A0A1M4WNE3_9FIRM|nr:ATP-binding cassette domain-containing protein [Alkalibacter saccharofermentans]SHE82492.1 osmoprotectant transport system ATP-binding protein [Alkalibacter saccharofermentans DSM 14828]
MTIIEFDKVSKSYEEGKHVIKDISLKIDEGEFVTLVGPSGCGKTTLLKMINKMIMSTSGRIVIRDKEISTWNTTDLRRSIGYVIQQVGLFPHMTIAENIGYVLKITGEDKVKRRLKALELIKLVGLDEGYIDKYPRQLSGGQKQRIGVARALAGDPDIILMDEPFGAVDEIARKKLQDEFKQIHQKLGKTIVFVTHDIHEALKLGTRIVLMNSGRIEQSGTDKDLVYRPRTPFVKDFFGIKGYKALLDENELQKEYEAAILKAEGTK